MLARAGLGDHAALAHVAREQRLADGVVHLVRAGVIQVLALQIDPRPAPVGGKPLRGIERARPSHVEPQVLGELFLEFRIVAQAFVRLAQLFQRLHERLGDEDAAVPAEVATRVGKRIRLHCADLTAPMNAAILFASLMPLVASTPLDTSTA